MDRAGTGLDELGLLFGLGSKGFPLEFRGLTMSHSYLSTFRIQSYSGVFKSVLQGPGTAATSCLLRWAADCCGAAGHASRRRSALLVCGVPVTGAVKNVKRVLRLALKDTQSGSYCRMFQQVYPRIMFSLLDQS